MAKKSGQNSASSSQTAFEALIRTIGLIRRVMEPYFAQRGISISQWAILKTLYRARNEGNESLRLRDISDMLLVRPPSVTRVVEELRQKGWLEWRVCQEDSRAKQVRLTETGLAIVEDTLQSHGRKIQDLMHNLNMGEQTQLYQLLGKLDEGIESLVPGAKEDSREFQE